MMISLTQRSDDARSLILKGGSRISFNVLKFSMLFAQCTSLSFRSADSKTWKRNKPPDKMFISLVLQTYENIQPGDQILFTTGSALSTDLETEFQYSKRLVFSTQSISFGPYSENHLKRCIKWIARERLVLCDMASRRSHRPRNKSLSSNSWLWFSFWNYTVSWSGRRFTLVCGWSQGQSVDDKNF